MNPAHRKSPRAMAPPTQSDPLCDQAPQHDRTAGVRDRPGQRRRRSTGPRVSRVKQETSSREVPLRRCRNARSGHPIELICELFAGKQRFRRRR
jgi:hypothetical protein